MPREFSRNQRLANQVLRTLSELLREEVKDPRVDGVSLTAVELARDLGSARVYFGLLDPDGDPQSALEGLNSAAGYLRRKLGQSIRIRHVPELRFVHDDSAAQAAHISRIIDSALSDDDTTGDEGN